MIQLFFGFHSTKSLPKAFCPRQIHCCNHQYLAPFFIFAKWQKLWVFLSRRQREKEREKYKNLCFINKNFSRNETNSKVQKENINNVLFNHGDVGEALLNTKGKFRGLSRAAVWSDLPHTIFQFDSPLIFSLRERLAARTIRRKSFAKGTGIH